MKTQTHNPTNFLNNTKYFIEYLKSCKKKVYIIGFCIYNTIQYILTSNLLFFVFCGGLYD